MGQIHIKRKLRITGLLRRNKIFINGDMAGQIRGIGTKSFTLPAGVYEIYIQSFFLRSNTLTVSLGENENIHLCSAVQESLKEELFTLIGALILLLVLKPMLTLLIVSTWFAVRIYMRKSIFVPIVLRQINTTDS